MSVIFIVLGIIVLIFFLIISSIYKQEKEINFLKKELHNNIKNIISILPNLTDITKNIIKYEDEIFNNLDNVKIMFKDYNGDIITLYTCYSILHDNLNSLFAISEAYSELSSDKFNTAKKEITEILSNIEKIKNDYNIETKMFNNSIKKFPKKLFAKILKVNEIDKFDKKDSNNKINLDIEKDI